MKTYFFNKLPEQISITNEFHNACTLSISDQSLEAIKIGKLKIKISNVENNSIIENCNITIKSIAGNLNISVGKSDITLILDENTEGLYNFMLWQNSKVFIGKNTTSNGVLIICDKSEFICGNDCMFSSNILIQSSDQHGIVDISNKVITNNTFKSIILGNHVWLGRQSTLTPNAKIGDGSVIGACSVVTNEIPEKVIAAGVPARVIKENFTWSRERDKFDNFSQYYLNEYENTKEKI